MFTKDLTVGDLLEFYRPLLPERQADVLELYFNDDLSLAEIAEDIGISRQGVRHLIKKGEESLRSFEDGLGLLKRFRSTEETAEEITRRIVALRDKITDGDIAKELDDIGRLTAGLTEETP